MKKPLFFSMSFVLLAAGLMLVLSAWAGAGPGQAAAQPAAAPGGREARQPAPYTMTSFGPWNAAVAKTHVPQVSFEKAGRGIKVTVQIDNHPMDPQKPHWIMWIRLEDMKGKILGEKTFKATDPRPAVAVFEIPAAVAKVKALERCNIHGVWLNEVDVKLP